MCQQIRGCPRTERPRNAERFVAPKDFLTQCACIAHNHGRTTQGRWPEVTDFEKDQFWAALGRLYDTALELTKSTRELRVKSE